MKQKRKYRTTKRIKKATYNVAGKEERIIAEAEMIAYDNHTVRSVSKEIGVCKSTVHRDCTIGLEELAKLDKSYDKLYADTRKAFNVNKDERAYRGGEATKNKYAKQRELKA